MQGESIRAASPDLRIGDVFAGHRIDAVLGRGGMGVVYQATDLRLNRVTALKVIAPSLSADEDFRRRFQRESQLAASVRQPNVVTIFQAGEADGRVFVTMELVRGVDLRGLITQRGRLDIATAAAIVAQIAAALDAAHASGLVHRDVKPANVLIATDAPLHVYLTDFGLTKRTSSQSGITKTGLFVGTIDYAAPEQIKGWPVDARADVYALGCVLFELLAGRPPFRRENEYATMYAHTSEPPPPLSTVAPGLPLALEGVVARALAKDPDQRYPSAGDLARAVEAAASGQAPAQPERTVAIGRAAPGRAPGPVSYPSTVAGAPQPHPVYGYGLDPAQAPAPPRPSRRRCCPSGAAVAGDRARRGRARDRRRRGGGGAPLEGERQLGCHHLRLHPDPAAPTQAARAAGAGPTVREGVAQLASVLDLSARGRTLTIDGQYSAAIANRQQVLDRLDGLTLAPSLERSRTLLRRAVQASLDADQALLGCATCAGTAAANRRATDLKQSFVIQFNPLASKYLQRSFDSNSL